MIPFLAKKSVKQFVSKQLFNRFFLFFIFFSPAFNAPAEWQTVHTFEKEWLVYQPISKAFLPYISTRHFGFRSKSVIISPSFFPQAYLKIDPSEDYTLFINGVYSRKLPKGSLIRLRLDSLAKKQILSDRFVLSFYGETLNGIPQKISIEQNLEKGGVAAPPLLGLKMREISVFNNFFAIAILSLLSLIGFLYSFFPKYFFSYFRFSDWLQLEIKDVVIAKMPFAFPNLIVIFILSLITSYLAYYHGLFHAVTQSIFLNTNTSAELSDALIFIGSKVVFAFFLFVLRLFMYQLFALIFKLDNLAEIHFFKSIQTNIQFFSVLIFFALVYSVYMGPNFTDHLMWISISVDLYFLFRAIYFFVIFKKHFKFNSLSLFAYLAIIEGQVLLFGMRELIFPEFM